MQDILNRPAKTLTSAQRQGYFRDGFIGVERLVSQQWLDKLNAVTNEFVEISRNLQGKDRRFDLEPDHSATKPPSTGPEVTKQMLFASQFYL